MVHIGSYNSSKLSSSLAGTPSLTINHEATMDLDSTNAFEGPEKLLEVWFAPSPKNMACSDPNGLKSVPTDAWKDMLDLVSCKVLSVVASDHVDAYLLSESSMFVWRHKLILKTCGTTTLLFGLPRILEIAASYAGFSACAAPVRGIATAASPYRVFYSRKNYLFPDRQRGPHRSWKDEVRSLDRLFLSGSAYMIGKMNGEHWYLYVTEPYTTLSSPSSPEKEPLIKEIRMPDDREIAFTEANDETLEILMTDLDEKNAKQFYLDHASAVACGRQSYSCKMRGDSCAFDKGDDDDSDNFSVFGGSTTLDFSDSDSSAGDSGIDLPGEGHELGTVVSQTCGLSDVYPVNKYPNAVIDSYLFAPCGFSANGVVPAPEGTATPDGHYFTVHVTPEPHCSYASFETNVPQGQTGRSPYEIVRHVVGIFKPGRFTTTLFEAKSHNFRVNSEEEDLHGCGDDGNEKLSSVLEDLVRRKQQRRELQQRNSKLDDIPGYRRVDRIVQDLDGYDLVFRHYERNDWRGGAPRIGERP